MPHVVHKEGGRQGGREGRREREISLEKSDNGIIRQNTDVEIQVPQGGPITKVIWLHINFDEREIR